MKKILLLGASGMAGHMVYFFLKETNKYEIVNTVHKNKLTEDSIILDATDKNEVTNLVKKINPNIIINCIGILTKGSKEHPDKAIFLNAYLPHLLKKISDEIDAKIIHISTDCVFSGKKGDYEETDFRDADDIYGRSKALGEIINNKDITIRTSIIGPELKPNGEGLFHWFMMEKGKVKGYCSAIWSGVTTLELAKAIDKVIENNLSGLIHLTNGESIDKFTLLSLIKEIWGKNDISIVADNKHMVNKSLKKTDKFDFEVPSYRKMLLELQKWMINHENIYKQYI